MKKPDIRAAGAVVLRVVADRREALIIHRPRYDDWSLPKGKLERGETAATAAVREVAEETGVRVRLVQPLASQRYKLGNELKQVDWWRADVVGGADPDRPIDPEEVDRVAWVSVDEAAARLSYANETDALAEAVAQPAATPLLILRHAEALPRKSWSRPDSERPINGWGRRQARALVPLLAAFGVRRVVSSSSLRCLQTVAAYALRSGHALEGWNDLTEERHEDAPDDARRVMVELAAQTGRSGVPTVVCGHRPVFPAMLQGLGVPDHKFATAETLVVALGRDGSVVGRAALPQRIDR